MRVKNLIIASALLLLWIVPTASVAALPTPHWGSATIKVTLCHATLPGQQTTTCRCDAQACHHTSRPPGNLDDPGYYSSWNSSYPLVRESRSLSPKPQAGSVLDVFVVPQSRKALHQGKPQHPLQTLKHLRSVVLRH